ncbi:hypothetical protein [Lentibacillus juripiscarius]|uniref:Uncharacterized protein n=1 Tax=Lentibacillus juripiscarius TaxID=257446 RepID=A0ABW5V2L9_9BACI
MTGKSDILPAMRLPGLSLLHQCGLRIKTTTADMFIGVLFRAIRKSEQACHSLTLNYCKGQPFH